MTMDDILYLCDRRACEKCRYPECKHTSDINHAVDFARNGGGLYVQNEFADRILEVKLGDTLVLKADSELSDAAYKRLNENVKEKVPKGTKILFLENGLDASVLRFEDRSGKDGTRRNDSQS